MLLISCWLISPLWHGGDLLQLSWWVWQYDQHLHSSFAFSNWYVTAAYKQRLCPSCNYGSGCSYFSMLSCWHVCQLYSDEAKWASTVLCFIYLRMKKIHLESGVYSSAIGSLFWHWFMNLSVKPKYSSAHSLRQQNIGDLQSIRSKFVIWSHQSDEALLCLPFILLKVSLIHLYDSFANDNNVTKHRDWLHSKLLRDFFDRFLRGKINRIWWSYCYDWQPFWKLPKL